MRIARRLLRPHRAASGAGGSGPPDLWTLIAEVKREFVALLERDDPDELAAYLCNVSRHSAAHGIAQGHREYWRILRDPGYRDFLTRMAFDKLVLLAEALGVVPPDNPEQGAVGSRRGSGLAPSELVERLEASLGLTLAPPPIDGGMLKLDTGRGLFGDRDLNAIYTARLLVEQADRLAGAAVCEIGGGTGRVAHWAARMGQRS